jgi:signal transduction histidine kinase
MRTLALLTIAALTTVSLTKPMFGAGLVSPTSAKEMVLTNAAQIRQLTPAQAGQAIPVKLRGVVVDESQPSEHAVIFADQTASIYVSAVPNLFAGYHPRDLLEIAGVTSKGEFAPCVIATKVIARERGNAIIPPPHPTTYQDLITGALDAQYVEISGVVRQTFPPAEGDQTWRISLAANGGVIPIRIPLPQDTQIAPDAEVTVQAVCLYQFNQRRQALNPVLQVPHGRKVRVDKPAPPHPFDIPLQPLDSLQQFSPETPFGHRVHVHGVVTLCHPESSVWIHDESAGLRLQTEQTDDLQPGDEIEVLGFPGYGASAPVLEDAIYKKTGKTTPPVPLAIANATNAYDHQDDLVSMEATLTDIQPVINGVMLSLERDNTIFKAILKFPLHPNVQPNWQLGSVVRAAGICDIIYDNAKPVMGAWHPQSFQLLMRSPADLTILKAPSWWNPRHLILVLSISIAGLLAISGGAARAARLRLKEQDRNRKMAEAEFAAVLSERNRLAREIHDTLAQGFTATLLQLQLIRNASKKDQNSLASHLDKAEQLIRSNLREARNSIWQMSPQVLETGSLVNSLKDILKQLAEGVVSSTHFDVTGPERRLPPIVESNILRLGQEAITNVIKHARATCIRVKIEFQNNRIVLVIQDDGRGFDPANPPRSEGGFGLIGMQGRAKEIKGELEIRSTPNKGTELILSIPIGDEVNSTQTG